MLFSSMEFLWLFLPIVFIVNRLLPRKANNVWLLLASLFFYAFGEPVYILLMLCSIFLNYISGIIMDPLQNGKRKLALVITVIVNLGLLGYFKYFDFFVNLLNLLSGREVIAVRNIALPIGISFYTFQILSYIIDLYRREIKVQKNPLNLALYISFFPQLIAGPIVNYRDIEYDLTNRTVTLEKTAYGVKRFIYGLSKKVLFANTFALTVDKILELSLSDIPSSYLWFAYLLYALQIYFDFSGYSDMAIGFGKMFGFTFLENFDYPYLSSSITEFWRRWHISLSTWFRDYLYIPLGGNRKGLLRTCLNLLIVFVCTGLWHGAGLSFLFWGLWHGFFLILERFWLKNFPKNKAARVVRHIYTLIVVYFGWIFFRAGSITKAFSTIVRMFSFSSGNDAIYFEAFGGTAVVLIMAVAIFLSGPLQELFPKIKRKLYDETSTGYLQITVLIAILFLSIVSLVSDSYNPFIYFRF
jgi:alginate O-acetyltransferase complex protein AlgI